MLHDTLKQCRKKKGLSQEELALQLHVVRQTISKWEKGLSVPDADLLIQIAAVLEVPVSQLLGTSVDDQTDLPAELARLNEQLAQALQREQRLHRANEKRGLILFLSFLALLTAFTIQCPVLSLLTTALCLVLAVLVLYRNLALLTSITTEDPPLKPLRITTIFNLILLLAAVIFALLTALDVVTITTHAEKLFAMALIFCLLLFTGMIAPHLPFNRHIGLRHSPGPGDLGSGPSGPRYHIPAPGAALYRLRLDHPRF